jgi:hypothetical protein
LCQHLLLEFQSFKNDSRLIDDNFEDSANLTHAEEAFSIGISITEKQKARSFGL